MMQYLKHRWHAFTQWEQRLNPRGVLLFPLMLLVLVLGMGLGWLNQLHVIKEFGELETESKLWNYERLELEKRNAALDLELKMEQQSQQETRALMARQRGTMEEMERELAFYRNIMAPEKTADGVHIHDLVVDETASAQRFRFRLVLSQQKIRNSTVRGTAQVTLDGSQNGKARSLKLTELGGDEERLAFSFRYFQELEGSLKLPDGFVPERIRVNLRLPASGNQRAASAETAFPITELISEGALARLIEKA
ncbi:DUF6776 family protein [Ferrimonas marina]|uniref:Uncharacterized protein n=1 Tax=Ferrimonas marina TaxID=299255 RepID=A0A1M5X486_9GAMM|nr:DUF6776 family protein [Ferrimonas marina]SHH94033.1 hypothetical protein SAMN02745129_3169 [Ferrimonas marina]